MSQRTHEPAPREAPPEDLGALELAAALRSGAVDAREHTEAVLARAAERGPAVGAFAHLLTERSRRQADCAAQALGAARSSEAREELARTRPLLGVPLPLKALSRIAGEPFEGGSAALAGMTAEVTDGVAASILEGGTVTIGLTTAPELGLPCYTEPATSAPARTPWDPARIAGGSSGGAAAAVAAGIVPLAHGSDGGGSVRIPASCCGVVGMKPTRGLVSPGPFGAEGFGLVTDGVLARSVRDAAAGLSLIARTRPGDAWPQALPAPGSLVSGGLPSRLLGAASGEARPEALRIGVLTEPLAADCDVHPGALRAVERARTVLEGLGHACTQIPAPYAPPAWRAFMPLWTVGAAAIPLPPEREELLTPYTRWIRERGREYSGVEVAAAFTQMQMLARQVGEAFAPFDVILTPTLAAPPLPPSAFLDLDPEADFDAQCAFTPWTSTWNMTGSAAISVPLHREAVEGRDLPFGVQVGAVRHGDDALLLALAAQLDGADPWPLITWAAA